MERADSGLRRNDWTGRRLRGEMTGEITGLRGEMVGMEGRINKQLAAVTGQIAKFSLPIVLTLTGLGLAVLGLTITLIISGALTGTT